MTSPMRIIGPRSNLTAIERCCSGLETRRRSVEFPTRGKVSLTRESKIQIDHDRIGAEDI